MLLASLGGTRIATERHIYRIEKPKAKQEDVADCWLSSHEPTSSAHEGRKRSHKDHRKRDSAE